MPDGLLGEMWRSINWTEYEAALRSYQYEIARAAKSYTPGSIYKAQKELLNSIEAKALAVKHVCDSAAQSGVDGVRWTTDAAKMRAANSLQPPEYTAQPSRLVKIIQESNGKERHVQIPVYFDRAMHTLHAYSLDPVSESKADKKSFAFRKGRSITEEAQKAYAPAYAGKNGNHAQIQHPFQRIFENLVHKTGVFRVNAVLDAKPPCPHKIADYSLNLACGKECHKFARYVKSRHFNKRDSLFCCDADGEIINRCIF